MESSRKGIKQIGPYSFLYCFSKDIIYNIQLNLSQDKNNLTIRLIKMKKTNTCLFSVNITKDEYIKVSPPLKPYCQSDELIKELSLLVYNHNFMIKEQSDCVYLIFSFDQNVKNNKTVILKKIVDKSLNENPTKDNMNLMKQLMNIVNLQKEKIIKLEQSENDLINRVKKLEAINQKLIDYVNKLKEQPPVQKQNINQNPYQQNTQQSLDNSAQLNAQNQKSLNNNINTNNSNSNSNKEPQIRLMRLNTAVEQYRHKSYHHYVLQHPKNPLPSSILSSKSEIILNSQEEELIRTWLDSGKKVLLELIYQGSLQAYNSKAFYNYFADISPTITFIKCDNGARFGGFTSQNWKGENIYKTDPYAFLFSLNLKRKYPIIKEHVNYAIYCNSNFIVGFGNGYDIEILNRGNVVQCTTHFPLSYGFGEKQFSLTGGKQHFTISEIEIFKVNYL